jgi:hypothetical protein
MFQYIIASRPASVASSPYKILFNYTGLLKKLLGAGQTDPMSLLLIFGKQAKKS